MFSKKSKYTVPLKSKKEISILQEGAKLLSILHGKIASIIKPGISTNYLNSYAEKIIEELGAEPSFKGYRGFPASICTSINDVVVHGIPSETMLKEGDIISVDCAICYKGYHTDAAFTHPVGKVAPELLNLLHITEVALQKGIEVTKTGNHMGDIGNAIEQQVTKANLGVVDLYGGHGIGKELHENPFVPNTGSPGEGILLKEGMVLAIEPLVTLGSGKILEGNDGWGVYSKERKGSAHFEHTVAIISGEAKQLTTYNYIKELKKYG